MVAVFGRRCPVSRPERITRPPQEVPYTLEEDPDRLREIYLEQESTQLEAQFDYEAGWRL